MVVFAVDLPGHGKTTGMKPGYAPNCSYFWDTVDELLDRAESEHPGLPMFLFGHSMGGNVAANWVLRRGGVEAQKDEKSDARTAAGDSPTRSSAALGAPRLKGVVLSAPWLRLAFAPSGFDLFLAKAFRWTKITKGNGLKTCNLSHDEEEVRKYEQDPLVHDKVSPSVFCGMTESGEWALANAPRFPAGLPLLLLHGTDDRVTCCKTSEKFASSLKGDVTFAPMDGLRHECHNESLADRERTVALVGDWLNHRLAAARGVALQPGQSRM
eukprot:Selendium_serpulae@DN4041_c1_g1_i1.p1